MKQNEFKKLGTYLKNKRLDAGLTQTQASKQLNYTPQFICNWEKGKSMPPLDKLYQLSKLYKIDSEELIQEVLEIQEDLLRLYLNSKRKSKRKSS
ncbi:MAG: helix-turn-helix transcriptional regulator [Oligoflexia bacterium]|nr:helix-turn-helix transcriptional regulator [Oligoflexia bacterium]